MEKPQTRFKVQGGVVAIGSDLRARDEFAINWEVIAVIRMWWSSQNLDKPFRTKDGGLWHFRVWNDVVGGRYIQRIYFWDDAKMTTGCAEFAGDQALHLSKVRQRKLKLATDLAYRERFRQELKFPVERYHA